MNSQQPKKKIAILGAGMSSIAAAYELTATPELRERYDITFYQLGWRIGGKGASGRNQARYNRIEEHGLHVWFGFYDNAFRAMKRCYEELGRPPEAPLATLEKAFRPTDYVVLHDYYNGKWSAHQVKMPPNSGELASDKLLPTFWEMVEMMLGWAREVLKDLIHDLPELFVRRPDVNHTYQPESWFDRLVGKIKADLRLGGYVIEVGLLTLAHELAKTLSKHPDQRTEDKYYARLCHLLNEFRDALWTYVVEPNLGNDELRFYFTTLDVGISMCCGTISDGLLLKGFDHVNHLEFRQWLSRHGAKHISINGPAVRVLYDLCFAFEGGDVSRPNAAAGASVRALLRMVLTYKGHCIWKMQAGMGDTVFTPFYRVLQEQRKVKFKFFHCVQELRLSEDKRSVAEIDVIPQVELSGDDYQPLFDVNDLPCWPSEPLWTQLKNGAELKNQGINFEHACNPLNADPFTLHQGRDFDIVILGISVNALPAICQELYHDQKNSGFKAMLDNASTVMTQAFQLWINEPLTSGLGWSYEENSVSGSYVEPLDTFCNMSHLIKRESWPEADHLSEIAYFCGVLADKPGDTQAHTTARARRNALEFVADDIRVLWPKAVQPDDRNAFKWNLLIDPKNRQGRERFDNQYWRANFQPTEHYVLSPAQSIKYRLRTDESGYDNLYLTGDWIKNGFDLGCIEAATMAGMETARAISGVPINIVGEHDDWLGLSPQTGGQSDTSRPVSSAVSYVEYSGRTINAPMPAMCKDTTLFCFFLKADLARLSALCRQCFLEPTQGAVEYVPLTDYILLTVGDVAQVSSMMAPFSNYGYVQEKQVAIWLMLARARREGPILIAENLAYFVPYIFVENPVSFSGGREVLGYAKNWGRIGMPDGQTAPQRLSLDAFGTVKFSPSAQGKEVPLLELTRAGDSSQSLAVEIEEVVKAVFDMIFEQKDGKIILPGLQLAENLLHDFKNLDLPVIFLKQFRDSLDGRNAAYQALIQSACRVTRFGGLSLLPPYHFNLHHLDSHPLEQDLGLTSQDSLLAYRIEMDFVQEVGTPIWEAHIA